MIRQALAPLAAGEPAPQPTAGPAIEVHTLGVRDELVGDGPVGGPSPVDRVGSGQAFPVFLYGQHAVLGPAPDAVPGRAGCPGCLARRWQSVRPATLRDALELGGGTRAVGVSPYLTPFTADLLAALIQAELRYGRHGDAARPAGVQHVDLATLRVRRLPLVPDPECPRCGRRTTDSRDRAVLRLAAAPKPDPGSFRVRGIEAYPLDVEAFVNPVCGALSASAIHDLSSTSTAAVIGAFTLRSGPYLRETLYGGHTDSYATSARVAVLEGLERAAGLRARGKTATLVAPLRALGDEALDARTCGLYSEEFYRANPYLTRFTPDTEVSWVWGYSLRDERPILVPEVLAYYHTPPVQARFVQETSNGCASGGSLEEAVYFGLMEVVERDAFLLAWYGRAPLPEIEPQSSSRPETRQMVDRLAMYGYQARFFDARITFPIPVVTGVAVRRDGGLGTLCFGGGASLDPEAALAAALCEIATDAVKLRVRAGADEARLRPMLDDFDLVRGLHDHPLLYGLPPMARHASFLLDPVPDRPPEPLRDRFAGVAPPSADLLDDLHRCVAGVTSAGFDVIVVDQTLPEQRDLGLHTVKVIVPGLVPIDFGWQRQRAPLLPRTRTALRVAGRRDRDLRPDEIHTAPHPFP
ncbi:TOMM precursor leader peptide-binding protein [Micromonospora sp. NBC_01699]|nr:TOMM precursor leader peptide-binding protein [Micromonospora sp. NBC_01699]